MWHYTMDMYIPLEDFACPFTTEIWGKQVEQYKQNLKWHYDFSCFLWAWDVKNLDKAKGNWKGITCFSLIIKNEQYSSWL